ncbi:helix-turn-helix transcriptional regulator [Streptomyces sp. NPDC002755]|uniref:helix-turn-helix transcriptional regulator n=1 Tax=Streptomyces sp. NPDC002884 TaxID=3154544 RepID=UPI003333807C
MEQPNSASADVSGVDRIRIVVHAPDPISRAGAMTLLGDRAAAVIITGAQQTPAFRTGPQHTDHTVVGLVVADALDTPTLLTLQELSRDGLRAALVVTALRDDELPTVVANGVKVIVHRHEATAQRLWRAVEAASRDDVDLPRSLLSQVIGRLARRAPGSGGSRVQAPAAGAAGPDRPSERELDVLRLIADGLNTEQIAAQLSCSQRTVRNVVQGLTERLGLHNRPHAVAYGFRAGHL